MIRLFKHYVPHAVLMLGLVDLVLLIVSAETGWILRAHQIGMAVAPMHTRMAQLLTFAIALQVSLVAVGAYGVASFLSLRFAAARLAVALSLGVMVLSLVFFLVPPLALWRSNLLYSTVIATVLLVTVRALLGKTLGGETFKRRIVVLGAGVRAAQIQSLSQQPGINFVVAGFVLMGEAEPIVQGALPRGDIPNLAAHIVDQNASEVVLALDERRNALPMKDLLRVRTTGVQVSEISSFLERETGRIDLKSVNPSWLIFSDGFASSRMLSSVFKRAFDIIAGGLLLALTLPIILLTAIAIKLESKGPAFYRQRRVGLYNEGFDILKLRSMRQDAEVAGTAVWAA